MTMKEFLASQSLKLEYAKTFRNPDMEDGGEDKGQKVYLAPPYDKSVTLHASHWQCKLSQDGREMVFHFTKGSAHHNKRTGEPVPPALDEVLDCLASDASGFENAKDFEDWAGEYGYDTDSRKAEKTYNTVKRQAEELQRVLGEGAYKQLLWEVERM